MSSKVLGPDDAVSATPVVWRQAGRNRLALTSPGSPSPELPNVVNEPALQTENRIREAHAAGFREGEAAARNQAASEVRLVVERLARSIEELARMRDRLRREAEADLVKLSLAIARRILRRELAVDPDATRGVVLAALEKLQMQEVHRVRVHPAHAPLLKECLQRAAAGGLVEVIADPSRELGAVIFETARGNLDASVDSQLQEIERGLTDRLRR
jgi:flagellar assembly protein FliH